MSDDEIRFGLVVDDPETERGFSAAVRELGGSVEYLLDFDRALERVAAGNVSAVAATFPPAASWVPFLSECAERTVVLWLAPSSRVEDAYVRGMVGAAGGAVFAHAVLDESQLSKEELRRALLVAQHVRRLQAAARAAALSENEALQLARMVLEDSQNVVFRWRLTAGSPVSYVSENVRIFGYTPEEMLAPGFFYQAMVHPEDLEATLRQLKALREDGVDAFTLSYRLVTRDGEIRWVEDRTRVMRAPDGQPSHHEGVVTDVTARRDAQAQLLKLSQAVEQSPGAVAIADLRGRIEYVNPRYCESTGVPGDQIVGRELIGFAVEGEGGAHRALWQAIWKGEAWRGEVRKRRRDGTSYWELLSVTPIRNAAQNVTHFLEVGEDITERRRAEDTIRQMAFFDALTQLPNRILFNDRLAQALPRARRDGRLVAVLFLDLDKFKAVNDVRGHAEGDELLRQVAARLRGAVREGDTVARMGGDEFLVLLPSLEKTADAGHVARKILAAIQAPFALASGPLSTSTSVGVSVFPDDAQSAEDLLKNADEAMYRAKEACRGGFAYFAEPEDGASARKVTLRDLMVQALVRNEFELRYHPVVDLSSGVVVGLEALLRWNHPDRGPQHPSDFLPLIEGAGLAAELDRWVVRTACAALQRWGALKLPAVRVGCNVVARQLGHPGFVSRVLEPIVHAGVPAASIEVELEARELGLAGDAGRAALAELREFGVRVAVGGVANADWSLQRLRSLHVDAIKLERDLVRQLTHSREAVALVRALVGVAATLQLDCVAQGVETKESLDVLRTVGCRYAQGFALSLPLREDELPELFGRSEPEWSGSVSAVDGVVSGAQDQVGESE